jgi:septal ring factor EnvC (AmiA/AmiB activator)
MLMNVLRKSLHEEVIPEINLVRAENTQIKTTLGITNKRRDDLNAHLANQPRRIDETNQRIGAVHADVLARIDATNDRLNRLYEVIVRREEHDGLAHRLTRLD